ncbi:pentapeptide repeat-containing protein [Candidatus Trichorickettsia mobilis]|uniref:pentapeptide repeat-containing protein n=1 Tax=Candidatus Trichorickettsia mobilis TaxID=1346319 RepID=UPI00292D4A90|nr:pentapeptide repeat-containing protein [Candidatus Trichorickettsia mobilis]
MAKSDESLKLDLNVKIKAYEPTLDEIKNYVQAQQQALKENSNITLNDYLKENSAHKGSNTVVVADLSGMEFDREYKNGTAVSSLLDLKGVDFSGSIIKNTSFTNCDLTDAVFCDTDLTNANFKGNNTIKNIDFRGADLATCQFDNMMTGDQVAGIKFSTTSALGRQYADIKGDIFRTIERQELVKEKEQAVNAAYKNLGVTEKLYVTIGVDKGNKKYDDLVTELDQAKAGGFPNKDYTESLNKKKQEVKEAYSKLGVTRFTTNAEDQKHYDTLSAELKEMRAKPPEKDYIMHKSFQNVFSSQSDTFDPAYTRGSSKAERDQPKGYVELSRENVVTYLDRIKTETKLSLNDFAKEIKKEELAKEGKKLDPNTKYIADCSAKGNTDSTNSLRKVDLSGLDFTNAKIDGVSFAGSDLRGCNFTGADISRSSFEGADLGLKRIEIDGSTRTQGVIFDNTTARDANFFNTNFNAASIKDSDFKRAYMPRSDGSFAQIESTNFDYANIKNGKWDQTTIKEATFNFANMEGISLAGADMRKVQAQHAILNGAILTNCNAIESDFTKAHMNNVTATKANLQDTILKGIEAKGINLSDAELNEFTKLDGANLEGAILKRINAERVSFVGANMDKVDAEFAKLSGADLEGVKARFAKLDGAILDEVKASGVDLTGAKLNNIKARSADFTKAVMEGVEAKKADFTKTDFTEADLQNANLKEAILKEVNLAKAKVNTNTNLAGADIKGAVGKLQDYGSDGKNKGEKSIEEQKVQSEKIEAAKNMPWYKKAAGTVLDWCGKGLNKAKELAGQAKDAIGGFISKYGKVVGAVVGVGIAITVAAGIVATGGLGLAAAAAVYGGCALAGAAIGAVGAHYGIKHAGVGAVVGGLFAASVTGSPTAIIAGAGLGEVANKVLKKTTGVEMGAGTALGVTLALATGGLAIGPILAGSLVGVSTDVIVEKATGKSLAEWGKDGYKGLTELCEKGAEKYGSSPELKALIAEQTKCQAIFDEKAKELKNSMGSPDTTLENKLKNDLARQQDQKTPPLDQVLSTEKQATLEKQQQTVNKTVEKEKLQDNVSQKLQETASKIGDLKSQQPTKQEDKSKDQSTTVINKKAPQQVGGRGGNSNAI